MSLLFVTGIDTSIGKTIATGLIARALMDSGESVTTMKVVQTGCPDFSEDIDMHRKIMQIPRTSEDEQGITCPYCFSLPASPHLASRQEGEKIEIERIVHCANDLHQRYTHLIVEGAGGLRVPINETATMLDLLVELDCPIILVSSPRLGSINHTFMAIEAIKSHNLDLRAILYNRHQRALPEIEEDSRLLFEQQMAKNGFTPHVIDIPDVSPDSTPTLDLLRSLAWR